MKKIFTILSIAVTGFVSAQSIHVFENGADVGNTAIYDTIVKGALTLHDLELRNFTSNTVYYKVNRTLLTPLDPYSNIYFCTGTQCYPPQTAVTWTPGGADFTIGPNATLPSGTGTFGIAAHYDADSTVCNDFTVLYRVYNTMTAGDTAFVTVNYICTATGIQENELAGGDISAVYPNPANSIASIKYDMNQYAQKGKIILYDLLGKKLKEVNLTEKQGVVKVDVSEFNQGIYFYSFQVNNKVIAVKKMVIN